MPENNPVKTEKEREKKFAFARESSREIYHPSPNISRTQAKRTNYAARRKDYTHLRRPTFRRRPRLQKFQHFLIRSLIERRRRDMDFGAFPSITTAAGPVTSATSSSTASNGWLPSLQMQDHHHHHHDERVPAAQQRISSDTPGSVDIDVSMLGTADDVGGMLSIFFCLPQ